MTEDTTNSNANANTNVVGNGFDINVVEQQAITGQIARDIALSPLNIKEIKAAYELTDEQLKEITSHPVFIDTYRRVSEEASKDPTFTPQAMAREALTSIIPTLTSMVNAESVMNMDKISAAKLLTTIANVVPKEAKNATHTGVQVNLHFGTKPPLVTATGVVVDG